MKTVTSKDGTTIAYDQVGAGQPVILVTGALGRRSGEPMADPLIAALAKHFTVIDYDRRGRGDSTDTPPYAVEREIEDLAALIDAVGGAAYLYGLSSGAILALETAAKFPQKVKKLALFEPPFIQDDSRPPIPANYVEHLNQLVAEGRRGDAVQYFMTDAMLIPAEFVTQMRNMPAGMEFEGGAKAPDWSDMEQVAHTLAYDGLIGRPYMAGKPVSTSHWAAAGMPTLVMTGGMSEPFFHDAAKTLVRGLPDARHHILEGQNHAVSPLALAPLLVEFFGKET
jgi:pimeloyl-ACP methyl ester carboxylesterase